MNTTTSEAWMSSTANGSYFGFPDNVQVVFTVRRPDDDPPPAGVRVPAPEPFPPGPLRWDAIRLDRQQEELPHA